MRGRLILRAAAPDQPPNLRVAAEMHGNRPTVGLWRHRYGAYGLAGLQDAPRSGRPRSFSPLGAGRWPVHRHQEAGGGSLSHHTARWTQFSFYRLLGYAG